MTPFLPPVGQDLAPPLAQLLAALRDGTLQLFAPTRPLAVFACLQAELPPPVDHRHCQAVLSDSRRLVISTYSGSAWEWTNADGSPL